MYLNTLAPAEGSKKARVRVGRGIGSGIGKTSGRGHKGQKARSGGYHKVGFEGGQMPIQRRLPKFGFYSHKKDETAEVRLSELSKVQAPIINLQTLKEANLIRLDMKYAKIFLAGAIEQAVHVQGLRVTKGARAAIEAAGGRVED